MSEFPENEFHSPRDFFIFFIARGEGGGHHLLGQGALFSMRSVCFFEDPLNAVFRRPYKGACSTRTGRGY